MKQSPSTKGSASTIAWLILNRLHPPTHTHPSLRSFQTLDVPNALRNGLGRSQTAAGLCKADKAARSGCRRRKLQAALRRICTYPPTCAHLCSMYAQMTPICITPPPPPPAEVCRRTPS